MCIDPLTIRMSVFSQERENSKCFTGRTMITRLSSHKNSRAVLRVLDRRNTVDGTGIDPDDPPEYRQMMGLLIPQRIPESSATIKAAVSCVTPPRHTF